MSNILKLSTYLSAGAAKATLKIENETCSEENKD